MFWYLEPINITLYINNIFSMTLHIYALWNLKKDVIKKAQMSDRYSISQEICTRFCCALLCCGYAIVHNEFTWSIYPYSSGCFTGTGAIARLPQCQWSKPDGYAKISQCITTTKHSKAKTVCIFLGILYVKRPVRSCFTLYHRRTRDFRPLSPVLNIDTSANFTSCMTPT